VRPVSRALDRARLNRLALDLLLAAVVFAVLGVVGALIWHGVVDPPRYTRTAGGAEMEGDGLAQLFSINGWYCLIGAVLGLVAGAGLSLWRHREPVWVLLVSAAASLLGAGLMAQLGRALGPDAPGEALRNAKVGASAPVRLVLQGTSGQSWFAVPYHYAFLAGTILGATVALLFVGERPPSVAPADTEPVSTGAGDLA